MKKFITIILTALLVSILYAAKCRMIDTSYSPPCDVPDEIATCEEKIEKVCVVHDSIKRGRTTTSETISRGFLNFRCKSDTSPDIYCTDRTSNDCFFRQNYDCNNIAVSKCSYWITATGEVKIVEIEGGIKKENTIFEVERVKNGNRIQDGTRTYVTAD